MVTLEELVTELPVTVPEPALVPAAVQEIGRASCRERVQVAVDVAPVKEEVSWTAVPMATVSGVGGVAVVVPSERAVAMVGLFLETTRISLQAEVAALLLASFE